MALIIKQYLITVLLFSAIAYAAPNHESNKLSNTDTPAAECDENGDCLSSSQDCHEICGCDRSGFMAMQYNETTKTCIVSFKHLMIAEINIYGNDDDDGEEGGTIAGGTMANKIQKEAERIFTTIMISAIFFISCCAVCVISACFYCCRINYADYALQKDVKALAEKLQRDGKFKKTSKKQSKSPQSQADQSCNIICEEAGVFVV